MTGIQIKEAEAPVDVGRINRATFTWFTAPGRVGQPTDVEMAALEAEYAKTGLIPMLR